MSIHGPTTVVNIFFLLVRTFVKIPVPCNCGKAPSSTLLICQKDSEEGSENCERIKAENKKIDETIQSMKERAGRIISKAETLLPTVHNFLLNSIFFKSPKTLNIEWLSPPMF